MKNSFLIFLVLLVSGCTSHKKNEANSNASSGLVNGRIEKAFVSFRIGVPLWQSEERFKELLKMFDNHRGGTDEIALFTAFTHAPIPVDVFRELAALMKVRMEEARKHGYRAGVNVLATIGHHSENLDNSLKGDYTFMTNIDGMVCQGSYCPNDENVREYVKTIYQLAAEADPDFIWIDDDMRLWHMPVGFGCFCDKCLEIFREETGVHYTGASLKTALNSGDANGKLKVRRQWLDHNRNTVFRLLGLIEKSVHEVDPGIILGQMTGERPVEGFDYDKWAEILSGSAHTPVMWRPGAGYYDDNTNNNLAAKSHVLSNQVGVLPAGIVSIQSEIENFPYQRLKKAANIVALESASHIAAGCTGAAYNVLTFYDEPLDEYEPLIARLQEVRPFLDLMVRYLGRDPIAGIRTYWNRNTIIAGNLENGIWLEGAAPQVGYELFNIGLPACYSHDFAKVSILGKDVITALSDDEIREILSGGVYMDCGALQQLNDRGFGRLTGFEITGSAEKDRIEKFTGHPLNGEFQGRERDNRQSFWMVPAYSLRKTSENAQSLSTLIDYSGKEVSDCTAGTFENELGGRVCVSGYYPFTFLENLSKSSQMKSVFRWLSKDNLPGYIASFHKINLWIREPEDDGITLAFSNSSFDPAEKVILMLRTTSQVVKISDMECKWKKIRSSGVDGPYQKFVIDRVDPWQIRLLLTE